MFNKQSNDILLFFLQILKMSVGFNEESVYRNLSRVRQFASIPSGELTIEVEGEMKGNESIIWQTVLLID